MKPALALVAALLGLALLAGCDLDGDGSEAFSPTVAAPMPVTPAGFVAVEDGLEITQLAAGGGYVTWTTKFEDIAEADVRQVDMKTGKLTTVAHGAIALNGLASTRDWVVYALHPGAPVLYARSHDGTRARVLGRNVVGLLGARGDLVAWAQADGDEHRVVVEEMSTERQWVAATLPRCEEGRCFRIDAVSVSDGGVAFARGAIGAHPSQIWRRSFPDGELENVPVPNDPQPDLVPSSSGPAFTILGGRVRTWPFGRAAAEDDDLAGAAGAAVLGHERGWWFVSAGAGQSPGIYARAEGGSEQPLAEPPPPESGTEPMLAAFTWSGRQAFSAWGLYERESGEIESSVVQADGILPGAG